MTHHAILAPVFFTRRHEQTLAAILEGVRTLMALSPQILTLLSQMNDATNGVAARIAAALAASSVDDPDLVAALQAEVTKLQGLAADPANPVPAPIPPASPTP